MRSVMSLLYRNIAHLVVRRLFSENHKREWANQIWFSGIYLILRYIFKLGLLIGESCLVGQDNVKSNIWTASSEFGTYRLCEQRRFRRACASAQSRQNLRCSLIQAVSKEEPSDRKPDPWPLWMAGHVQLKFVMTECLKTQIRLAGLLLYPPIEVGQGTYGFWWESRRQSRLRLPLHLRSFYLVNRWVDSNQTCMNILLRLKTNGSVLMTLTSFSRSQDHLQWHIFTNKILSASYTMKQWMDSKETQCICVVGMEKTWWDKIMTLDPGP